MPEKQHTQKYHYRRTYIDTVEAWQEKLGERAAHELAQRTADGAKFVLTGQEYREINKWLDGKYKIRTKKPEEPERSPGLFDDSILRAE